MEILRAWEAANPEFLDFLRTCTEAIIAQRKQRKENLESSRDRLYKNLEEGYAKIERGLLNGEDVTEWEEFWTNLLLEYQRVCDELSSGLWV